MKINNEILKTAYEQIRTHQYALEHMIQAAIDSGIKKDQLQIVEIRDGNKTTYFVEHKKDINHLRLNEIEVINSYINNIEENIINIKTLIGKNNNEQTRF